MNELAKMLGLGLLSPVEKAYDYPTENNLRYVHLKDQTEDLIKYVCSNDGMALRYASTELITQEICEIAIKQNGLALQHVPDKFISYDLCYNAVAANGRALEYVPEKMKSLKLAETAVSYYLGDLYRYGYTNESYEEKRNNQIDNSKNQGEELDKYQGYPISFVPASLLTNDLIVKSVTYSPFSLRDVPVDKITKEISKLAVSLNGLALKYVPLTYQNKKLVAKALSNQPHAVFYALNSFVTQEMCNDLFEKDYSCFTCFPEKYITTDMCLHLIDIKRFVISKPSRQSMLEKFGTADVELITFNDFPEHMRNNKQVLDAIISQYKYGAFSIIKWNERIFLEREKCEEKSWRMPTNKNGREIFPLYRETLEYIIPKIVYPKEEIENAYPIAQKLSELENADIEDYTVSIPNALKNDNLTSIAAQNEMVIYDFSDDSNSEKVYYVSDIHIEHHVFGNKELQKALADAKSSKEKQTLFYKWLENKIDEMINGADTNATLLIGGDVADDVSLERTFFDWLRRSWKGTIITVLGNHELWDGSTPSDMRNPEFKPRTVEEIVFDYKDSAKNKYFLLENDVYVNYEGVESCIVPKNAILHASDEILTEFLKKCSTIIIGGIGYSGLNKEFNAENGLYRKTISDIDEDIRRTQEFLSLYNKMIKCAGNRRVIVLTHTPVQNWNSNAELYHKNWIYLNGHTHMNYIKHTEDGITVLADNQIGYGYKKIQNIESDEKEYVNPKWKLNGFIVDKIWYDPFDEYEDGIYNISSEQYKEFNAGRGILSNGCNYKGTLLMLKKECMYMFVLQTDKSLCLLAGGQRKKLDCYDVNYYYENMSAYTAKVNALIKPYRIAMQQLSEEVKKFGADGTIHGCIIDISWLSHIYVNPFDGTITPYWATDISSRKVFSTIQDLLQQTEQHLLSSYKKQIDSNHIPMIKNYLTKENEKCEFTLVPEWISGTEMYIPSRAFRSIQYVWEDNVIRIWNDDILHTDKNELSETINLLE